jgi:hypothetical protein
MRDWNEPNLGLCCCLCCRGDFDAPVAVDDIVLIAFTLVAPAIWIHARAVPSPTEIFKPARFCFSPISSSNFILSGLFSHPHLWLSLILRPLLGELHHVSRNNRHFSWFAPLLLPDLIVRGCGDIHPTRVGSLP